MKFSLVAQIEEVQRELDQRAIVAARRRPIEAETPPAEQDA